MTRKLTEDEILSLQDAAQWGCRIVMDGKTVWGGLGNRSGLHDYANVIIREKWKKSGERFMKKMRAAEFTLIEIQVFQNINRDRGRWIFNGNFRT